MLEDAEMSQDALPEGTCLLCGKGMTKRGMARHLKACRAHRQTPPSGRGRRARPTFWLSVVGSPLHWLHVEVAADSTLADLDGFLRRTWLECCGHLSEFQIDGVRYSRSNPVYEALDLLDDDEAAVSMDLCLDEVLRPGQSFSHLYDYGSTTTCRLRVTGVGEALLGEGIVEIQGRNTPLVYPCVGCGRPATHICSQCQWEGDAFYCDACGKKHACGEDMLLPVVDSPRMGVCGYVG